MRLFVKNEAKDLFKDKVWSFLCVFLAVSFVICLPVHLFNASCGLKLLIKKGLIKTLKVTQEYTKKLQDYQTFKRKNLSLGNFSQKHFLKNNIETNKQEQNISLNQKMNILDTLHGKGFKAKQ